MVFVCSGQAKSINPFWAWFVAKGAGQNGPAGTGGVSGGLE